MIEFDLIRFERYGGFSGQVLTYVVHAELLDKADADFIHNLVNQSGLNDHFKGVFEKSFPDQFSYKLVVERGSEKKEWVLKESEVPEALWPLIRYLTVQARKGK